MLLLNFFNNLLLSHDNRAVVQFSSYYLNVKYAAQGKKGFQNIKTERSIGVDNLHFAVALELYIGDEHPLG